MSSESVRQLAPFLDADRIREIAAKVGTPFYLYNADTVRQRIREILDFTSASGIQSRYAMKACSARRVLEEMRTHDVWIDAVSGNEILRAREAGYESGMEPPEILFTADVFRDNSLQSVVEENILPNVGTVAMLDELAAAGYQGPVGLRLNPGFGHGHVEQCDTGGPASKHGIWFTHEDAARRRAEEHGQRVTLLHAHIGTGAEVEEFERNINHLVDFFVSRVQHYPDLEAVNLGGGIPYPYRPDASRIDLEKRGKIMKEAQEALTRNAKRPIRLEIEPGRYFVASGAAVVTRVAGLKDTETNDKGAGHSYALVDAGFVDLVRPAMYGAYHHIEVLGKSGGETRPVVLAGPLCESGDVFTRDADELLDPRELPRLDIGDLVLLRDAGAYGFVMASNYNSIGRAPQVWVDGKNTYLMSRRESLEDVTRTECFEEL